MADGTTVINVEQLSYIGGSGKDTITGGALIDNLSGYSGNDTLNGNGGDDHLEGISVSTSSTAAPATTTWSSVTRKEQTRSTAGRGSTPSRLSVSVRPLRWSSTLPILP